MSKRQVGNLLGLAVLAYLTQRPMHPYELSRTLRDHGDDRSIKYTHGSLYMVFGQLQRAGLVEPVQTSREGQRPERTVYALTPAGRREVHDWLCDLVRRPAHEYPHFVAALSLIGALPPGEAVELLRERIGHLAQQRDDAHAVIASSTAAGVHPLFLIEEEYRATLLEAEIRFVQGFVERVTDPKDGWAPAWAAHHETLEAP